MKWLFLSIATLATSLLIGHSAAAQSAYDDHLHVVEDIYVRYDNDSINENVTNTWGAILQDKCSVTIDYDLPWAVVQYDANPATHAYQSVRIWQPSATQSWDLIWNTNNISAHYDTQVWDLYPNTSEADDIGCRELFVTTNPLASQSISTISGDSSVFIAPGWNPNYPGGYEGPEVPEVAPGGGPQRTPRATIAVNDKDLTIDFESAGGVNDYIYSWHLARYVPSSGLDWQTLEDFEAGFHLPEEAHSTYLDQRGNYALSIIMCAADHDQEIPECASLENTRAAWLDIFADGSYFSISTGGNMDSEDLQNCETGDLGGQSTTRCQAKLMDDCGLDGDTMLDKIGQIPGLITCQLANYFNGVRSLAMFLMIPSSHQLQQSINGFLDNVKAQLGFVYESFGILIGGAGDIITAAGTANCVLSLGTWYGDDLELSLCQVRSLFGETAWTLVMTLIRGGIAFSFVFSSYRYLQAFFEDRRAYE